ncbi:hypothetical protein [Acidovorax sp. SUPP2825]|uniref:DUF7684 family protein n=1 Tax=Acidovorax sp. SUPP2825 TaxID=2920879 RepID=UPI0023DE3E6D|nr:hypothetical protein [Acidovorax sp. SUPP2825]GKS93399.1 hypothetical protein AVAK2825_02710 [Acidovorax sp. SUPP2825]
MGFPNIFYKDICQPLFFGVLMKPFAALLDAGDPEWHDVSWVKQKVVELLEKGCGYFVCYGETSEMLHDLIDEVIEGHDFSKIITTYHCHESRPEVASFFKLVAMEGMNQGLIVVRNIEGWHSAMH